jgi:coiled-coil and C2 domain-containing protein 2A
MTDLYCKPQEFLDIGEGDFEEHAILLCNYFKYIDYKRKERANKGEQVDSREIDSYLVYGEAVPEGRTVYVLRKDKNEHSVEIWCPLNGECFFFELKTPTPTCCGIGGGKPYLTFRTQDPICPLKRIFNIVGDQNIYANIQKFDFPIQMKFDFSNKKDWKPLFDQNKLENFFNHGHIDPCFDTSMKYTEPQK